MQKMKSESLTVVLANVIQMKSEHLIHIKAKSERLICKRRSLNVLSTMIENVIHMKSEHLIHIKAKFERLICRR